MTGCAEVRDLLPEHALGALEPLEAARVEDHVDTCAGCRKELRELSEGMEAAAFLAPPVEPPPHLEERVVSTVRRTAGRRSRRPARAAALLAAVIALGAMGWGMAMADRAERMGNEAELAREDAVAAAERYAREVQGLVLSDRAVREAVLRPTELGEGGGRALLYGSEGQGQDSWVLVIAGGLDEEVGPYRARLLGDGRILQVGRLFPSAEGRSAAYLLFRGEADAYREVVILDGDGRLVLRGGFTG